jgi:glutamate synthase domain-containing protein 1
VVVVHNGTIENYLVLKKWLEQKGVLFSFGNRHRIVAALIDYFYRGDLLAAVNDALLAGRRLRPCAGASGRSDAISSPKTAATCHPSARRVEVFVCSDPAVGAIFSPITST